MGVDYVTFDSLVDLSTRFKPEGRTLMLGRQGFKIKRRDAKRYEASLKKNGVEARRFDFLQEDGYAETLMRKLGFGEMETMDFSDYEGASILHDLNKRPPKELENQFDFIFDGGTVEHVFNVPVALEGLYRMLKPGGRLGVVEWAERLVWARHVPVQSRIGLDLLEARVQLRSHRLPCRPRGSDRALRASRFRGSCRHGPPPAVEEEDRAGTDLSLL
ncbi:MAG: methyltransferase domain-containing protein [Roseovarius pacificus]|nr:methyltransferase domain-containing protein [Roseovarius pacificus]